MISIGQTRGVSRLSASVSESCFDFRVMEETGGAGGRSWRSGKGRARCFPEHRAPPCFASHPQGAPPTGQRARRPARSERGGLEFFLIGHIRPLIGDRWAREVDQAQALTKPSEDTVRDVQARGGFAPLQLRDEAGAHPSQLCELSLGQAVGEAALSHDGADGFPIGQSGQPTSSLRATPAPLFPFGNAVERSLDPQPSPGSASFTRAAADAAQGAPLDLQGVGVAGLGQLGRIVCLHGGHRASPWIRPAGGRARAYRAAARDRSSGPLWGRAAGLCPLRTRGQRLGVGVLLGWGTVAAGPLGGPAPWLAR